MLEFAPIVGGTKAFVQVCPGSRSTFDMMNRILSRSLVAIVLIPCVMPRADAQSQPASSFSQPEISRPARLWEFMPAVGRKAALLGRESGTIEAWVYPMKIFRDFSLVFHVGDREIPAEALVRTIEVHPEAVTLVYSGDTFSARETFFAPQNEPGAIIALDISCYQPLEIQARFRRDFQLIWPASLGGTYSSWDDNLHAFTLGEEQKKWFAIVGSPTANNPEGEFETNYQSQALNSFRIGPIPKGVHRSVIVVAGSSASREDAEGTYRRLSTQYDSLRQEAIAQYHHYLEQTTSLSLPDSDLQQAYDWSRISVLQGIVTNPDLGTGLVAGYRVSGTSQRPGFAWFFGRDSEWTSFALNSVGDFDSTRLALDFISKYQRQDGKIPHEISQAAKQVPWFTNFPYPWASADATPLFIIAVRDYYEHSGDTEFVTSHWDNIWRAYQFLRSTWDANGIPQNFGIGHGWIEGGPLMPVKSEFYQSGLGAEALDALSLLARVVGKTDVSSEVHRLFSDRQSQLNNLFWNSEGGYFAFALDQQDKRVNVPTVLTTVPMWFGLTDSEKSNANITHLADADHSADWGMRIISDQDPRYDPSGYHFGSVWPLFTGWASVAEYRYHRPLPAYENLRANALLAMNGSAGHTTEVLSGSFFEQLSTGSPHQIWSAAMVVSPMIRGLLGIDVNASEKSLSVSPHIPGDWTWWKARNIRVGNSRVDLAYLADEKGISFDVSTKGSSGIILDFNPSVSPHAKVSGVDVNGHAAKFQVQKTPYDQHIAVNVPLTSATAVRIRIKNDFTLFIRQELPPIGEASSNLKVVNETWSSGNDTVTYELAGLSGRTYEMGVRGPVVSVDGAEFLRREKGNVVRISFPSGKPGYIHALMSIHLGNPR